MEAAAATPSWVLIAYLIAGICFIVALRGLSSPATSQRGNRAGMIGMAIAVVTTLVTHAPRLLDETFVTGAGRSTTFFPSQIDLITLAQIFAAIAIGAVIGLVTARRIQMTAMPQLVAAFHSLVGMAAVLVGAAAFLNPVAFGIVDATGAILQVSRSNSASASRSARLLSRAR